MTRRKQARKHVRDARDFNKIETRAVIKFFFPARQNAEGNSRHSDETLACFLPGRAKDLQYSCILGPFFCFCWYVFLHYWIWVSFWEKKINGVRWHHAKQWPCGLRVDLWPLACGHCRFESHFGMDVCLLWVLCVVQVERSVRRADPSSRGVPSSVVCVCFETSTKSGSSLE